jgi:ferritin-like metal-binding protein YciE
MERSELFLNWLRDAHAMELALVPTLEGHAKDAEDNPEVKGKIESHLDQTKMHAEIIEECLHSLNEDTSALKTATTRVMGVMQGMSIGGHDDRIVKNAIADFAAEHFEIASYRALINAAEELGYDEIAQRLEQNLQDEVEMAAWLEQQLPNAVEMAINPATETEMAESFYETVDDDMDDDGL